jgi:WD40 repeat protein
LNVFQEGKDYAMDVAYSPDGRLLASSSVGVVRLREPETGRLIRTLEAPPDAMLKVVFSPDGRKLAAAGREPTVTVWDVGSGERVMSLPNHQTVSHGLAISPDGRVIASAGWDRAVRIWEFQTGRLLSTLEGHTERIFGLAISPDSSPSVLYPRRPESKNRWALHFPNWLLIGCFAVRDRRRRSSARGRGAAGQTRGRGGSTGA